MKTEKNIGVSITKKTGERQLGFDPKKPSILKNAYVTSDGTIHLGPDSEISGCTIEAPSIPGVWGRIKAVFKSPSGRAGVVIHDDTERGG